MLKVLSWKRMWNLTELQVMEICNSACDNHAANNELCAKNIKVQKHNHTTKSNWSKFPGSSWQEVWPKLARYCGRGIWIWDQLRDQENVLHVFCRQVIKTHKYLPILNDNFHINQPKLSLESAKTVFWFLQDAPLCVYGSARDFILLCNACKIKLNVNIFYCFTVQYMCISGHPYFVDVKRIWERNVAWDKLTPVTVSLLAFRRRHTSSVTWWLLKGYAHPPFNIRTSFEQNSLYFNKSS